MLRRSYDVVEKASMSILNNKVDLCTSLVREERYNDDNFHTLLPLLNDQLDLLSLPLINLLT